VAMVGLVREHSTQQRTIDATRFSPKPEAVPNDPSFVKSCKGTCYRRSYSVLAPSSAEHGKGVR